jgi:flagellar biosynthetic protein FliR
MTPRISPDYCGNSPVDTQFDSLAQLLPTVQVLKAWLLGGARVMPVVVLVPAFGLRALPLGARVGLALTLGLSVAPALSHTSALPFGLAVTLEALSSMPVAVSAAGALWAASMAGGLFDELRQGREFTRLPVVETGTSPTGALFALIAALAFLETGGTGRVITALSNTQPGVHQLLTRVVHDLLAGVHVAIALAVPFIVASVLFELTTALVARALSPATLQPLWAPLRTVFFLGVLAIMFERILSLIAIVAARAP